MPLELLTFYLEHASRPRIPIQNRKSAFANVSVRRRHRIKVALLRPIELGLHSDGLHSFWGTIHAKVSLSPPESNNQQC